MDDDDIMALLDDVISELEQALASAKQLKNNTPVPVPPIPPQPPTVTVPSPPILAVEPFSDTEIHLSWNIPSSGGSTILGYVIEDHFQGMINWMVMDTIPGNSYKATGLAPSTTYSFRVSAKNSIGIGGASAIVQGTTKATPVPVPPSIPSMPSFLVATPNPDGSVVLAWTAPLTGEPFTDYEVVYRVKGGPAFLVIPHTNKVVSPTFNVRGLAHGTSYEFEVAAINPAGMGAHSLAAVATTTAVPPASLDSFGIKKIKPDAGSPVFLTNFTLEPKIRNYASGKPSEPSVEYSNVIGPNPDDGTKGMVNQEFTYYVHINGFKPSTDAISTKILGGSHSSSHPDTGTCYEGEIPTDGSSKTVFQVERPHPSYHDSTSFIKNLLPVGSSVVKKWIGIKMITWLINAGKDRHIEMLYDFPVPDITHPPNNWRKYFEVDDTGQIPSGHIITPIGAKTTCRIDGVWVNDTVKSNPQLSDVSVPDFKYASLRSIL
jgi:Fibronectin type III domain